jgi:hypothetical protein
MLLEFKFEIRDKPCSLQIRDQFLNWERYWEGV